MNPAQPHLMRYGLTRIRVDFTTSPPIWHSVCACGWVGSDFSLARDAGYDGTAHEAKLDDVEPS